MCPRNRCGLLLLFYAIVLLAKFLLKPRTRRRTEEEVPMLIGEDIDLELIGTGTDGHLDAVSTEVFFFFFFFFLKFPISKKKKKKSCCCCVWVGVARCHFLRTKNGRGVAVFIFFV